MPSNRSIKSIIFAVLALAAGCQPPPPGVTTFESTVEGIHPFLVFDYGMSPEQVRASAARYGFTWGTTRRPDAEAGNPAVVTSFYVPFHYDPDRTRELAWWRANHPDWVLYRCDRTTPATYPHTPNIPLDLTNPEARAWFLDNYFRPASEAAYDAIAVDGVVLAQGPPDAAACGVFHDGRWVPRFDPTVPGDPAWATAVLDWLRWAREAAHALPRPLAIVANTSIHARDYFFNQLVESLDAILDEGGWNGDGQGGFLVDEAWRAQVELMEALDARGVPYFSISQEARPGDDLVEWALASYLMGKGGAAWIWIGPQQGYGVERWHRQFEAPIGHACGRYRMEGGVAVRDYSGGIVLVNPSAGTSASFQLDGALRGLDGATVAGALVLPPHSGRVLLGGGARCP